MSTEPVNAPVTVLVIDDDDEMRAVLRTFLEREGYRVLERSRAGGAISAVDAGQPDLIILDRVMPDTGGADLLPLLRRRFDIPVILITAFGGPDVEADALRRGAASYLEKPFRMSTIIEAVAHLTRARRLGGQGGR